MKFALDGSKWKHVRALQQIYDVTIVSNKGLVFMYRDDWQRICGFISETDECIYNLHHRHNPLMDKLNLWSACFLVTYDESEDFSCHAICDFGMFSRLCDAAEIHAVLLPYSYDITDLIRQCNAHNNCQALGVYRPDKGDILIEVEDN